MKSVHSVGKEEVMWIKLTEQYAEILLDEGEAQTLIEGKEVMGCPTTTFLSPFGKRIVVVRQSRIEDLQILEGKVKRSR